MSDQDVIFYPNSTDRPVLFQDCLINILALAPFIVKVRLQNELAKVDSRSRRRQYIDQETLYR